MQKRPILLVILAVLHLLEPLSKILVFKTSTGLDWGIVFSNLFYMSDIKTIIDFWFLFPIGGLALFGVKA